jgi:hypothetical protein
LIVDCLGTLCEKKAHAGIPEASSANLLARRFALAARQVLSESFQKTPFLEHKTGGILKKYVVTAIDNLIARRVQCVASEGKW